MKKKIILYYETHAWYFIVSKKKIKSQTGGYEKSRVKGKRGENALLCTLQSWPSANGSQCHDCREEMTESQILSVRT